MTIDLTASCQPTLADFSSNTPPRFAPRRRAALSSPSAGTGAPPTAASPLVTGWDLSTGPRGLAGWVRRGLRHGLDDRCGFHRGARAPARRAPADPRCGTGQGAPANDPRLPHDHPDLPGRARHDARHRLGANRHGHRGRDRRTPRPPVTARATAAQCGRPAPEPRWRCRGRCVRLARAGLLPRPGRGARRRRCS